MLSDVLDDNKLDDSSEDQNGNIKQAEGEIPNGFVRQKTSLVDTISRLLPANEEESKKSRIKEALGKLTDEMTGTRIYGKKNDPPPIRYKKYQFCGTNTDFAKLFNWKKKICKFLITPYTNSHGKLDI